MNIFVSYNWLKEYLKTDLAPEDFASRISLCGVGVERIYPQGEQWENIVIGKILEIKKHPNADKLKLVLIDLGNKKVEVVCGGSNLREGMNVAVALEGAKVRWHGEGEFVELKPAEIRGVKSEGMICAASEIGLEWQFEQKDSHGILDLSDINVKPGTFLALALNLNDNIFDIEVTTNRPDELSILGVAREAGTILKKPFVLPQIKKIKTIGLPKPYSIKIENKEPELCQRYQAVVIEGVKVEDSPWWLKRKLMTAGTRSINNIVDITNLVLWEMGQPLHAFDYDKLSDKKIIIRKAKKGEKIKVFDGVEYKLGEKNLVIADGKNPSAIAGIMGGETSGINERTKTIVLEAATFDPVSVRKTSRELGLRSESSNLFEKGLSSEATTDALYRAAELIQEIAGGKIVSKVFDLRNKKSAVKEIVLDTDRARKIIGADIKTVEMADILRRLGFLIKIEGKNIKAKAPYWREHDIEIAEDLIEEIARIYGYHNLPSIIPKGAVPDEVPDATFDWEKKIKQFAVSAGFCEAVTYSFISKKMLEDYNKKGEIKLANPLSEDLEYMRPTLLPGLLQIARENENNFSEGKIFELGRVYLPDKDLPKEELRFSGIIWGKSPNGELFYKAKGFVKEFLDRFGVDYVFEDHKNVNYHPARAIKVMIGKEHVACLGEIHPVVVRKFGVESQVGFFNFVFEKLSPHFKSHKTFISLPAYPGIKRDIAFIVDQKQEYEEIEKEVYSQDALVRDVEVFDVYEGKGVPAGKKSLALHISFYSSHKTLEAKEAEDIIKKIVKALKEKFKAEIRM
ncbi:phenylalanine--tRNA ligase subunit beta [Candidatus Parcubacteria bacterium]|nr:phenylalanine--tRNA ligase subunit beta [Candidatus Parcubacteria bacterium]